MNRWNASVVVVCPYCIKEMEVIVREPDSYTRTQSQTCSYCREVMEIEYSATVEARAVKKVDLVTDIRDEHGRRRYTLGSVKGAPSMIPDAEGFWTPANDSE